VNASPGKKSTHTESTRIRVLVADDHITVLEGLVAIIDRQVDMSVIARASNGREAVDLWREHLPDVALLDLRMPELDGIGALDEIRQQHATANIIVLTTYDHDSDVSKAIKSGAKGYLLKDAPRDELLAAIRTVHSGETAISPALVTKLATDLSNRLLTGRELEVLSLLALGKSNKEIGKSLYIGETTVKSHLRSIFSKLDVLSRTEAIATASRRGLIQI
jgi:DNA-binding NarL/FixJ family response regulator